MEVFIGHKLIEKPHFLGAPASRTLDASKQVTTSVLRRRELAAYPAPGMSIAPVPGYPVLVRPSYVLSGAAMRVVTNDDDLDLFLKTAAVVLRRGAAVGKTG